MLIPQSLSQVSLLDATVYHQRVGDPSNAFRYQLYYLMLPLSLNKKMPGISIDRPGMVSFFSRDYGPRDGSDLQSWIQNLLKINGIDSHIHEVVLLTMPRMFGHAFNPVSFWLCLDEQGALRAVLCEVNNTFGQHHSYLCFHQDGAIIDGAHWLEAEKHFHVSPFFPREGRYRFKFSLNEDQVRIWIHYFDASHQRKLITCLSGHVQPLTRTRLVKMCARYPMVGLKTLTLIHWQAIKLWLKKAKFYRLPVQEPERLTATEPFDESR